jgi:pimeloyl-ACP methyl ester carboxylesterase
MSVTVLTRSVRILGLVFMVVGLAAIVATAVLESGALELEGTELERRYAAADSRFVPIDGVRVHYTDTGSGPPIVLLHASYLSLRSWDAVAQRLEPQFRVIRLDLSGAGLTGDDPGNRYGIERSIELLRGLLAHLGIERTALVGTSSGGIVAFRFAAAEPQAVSHLVLINSAGLPRTAITNPLRRPASFAGRWIQARYRSRGFWNDALRENFIAPHEPAADLVQMTYDLNRRKGWRDITRRYLEAFSTGDPQSVLGRIRAPALVAWGVENRTLSHLEAEVFAHWLTATTTVIRKYPGLGHYAYLEDPGIVAADIGRFVGETPALSATAGD